jgi:hypothetical protein
MIGARCGMSGVKCGIVVAYSLGELKLTPHLASKFP